MLPRRLTAWGPPDVFATLLTRVAVEREEGVLSELQAAIATPQRGRRYGPPASEDVGWSAIHPAGYLALQPNARGQSSVQLHLFLMTQFNDDRKALRRLRCGCRPAALAANNEEILIPVRLRTFRERDAGALHGAEFAGLRTGFEFAVVPSEYSCLSF